ncbi:MAG TPA: TetR/AcrR family transcriptional regulator [Terriglobia bacterium]|nr:TetR/AcrR family transcriptional regulator [Terriglobia bacterium]
MAKGTRTDRRLERGAKARQKILRAAEGVFAKHGLDGARTEAIARAAGVNKALLFYHFKSKTDLFAAVIEESAGGVHRHLMDLLSSQGPAKEILLQCVSEMIDAIARRPQNTTVFQRAMMADSKLAARTARTYFVPRTTKLAALIRRGVEEREFRPVDGRQTALLITSLIVFQFWGASVVRSLGYYDPFSKTHLKKRKQAVIDFVRYGLFRDQEVTPRDA